jgi:hypothetical protein
VRSCAYLQGQGRPGRHLQLPPPAKPHCGLQAVELSHNRALARLRLSEAPIQTNMRPAARPPRSAASLLTFLEVGRFPMQILWRARTLRYWNKLTELVQQGPSLICSTLLANVASGLACSTANTWAAELRAALQCVCPNQVWTPHMLHMWASLSRSSQQLWPPSLQHTHTAGCRRLPRASLLQVQHAHVHRLRQGDSSHAARICLRACLCPTGTQTGPGPPVAQVVHAGVQRWCSACSGGARKAVEPGSRRFRAPPAL